VKLFHFTPFGRKQLQTAPEAGEEAMPNRALESTKAILFLDNHNGYFTMFLIFLFYFHYLLCTKYCCKLTLISNAIYILHYIKN
jgi:hypothetical protein